MAWTTQTIIDWLTTLGVGGGLAVDLPLVRGDQLEPDIPTRFGAVTRIPGPGNSLIEEDRVGGVTGFQLRVVGEQSNPASGEELAVAADRAILTAPLPVAVGGVRLLVVVRSGGPPAPIAFFEDSAERTPYTSTYLTTIL